MTRKIRVLQFFTSRGETSIIDVREHSENPLIFCSSISNELLVARVYIMNRFLAPHIRARNQFPFDR